jgi:methyl-accepting chemotaxis protein
MAKLKLVLSSILVGFLSFALYQGGLLIRDLRVESKKIIPAIERQSLDIQNTARAVIETEMERTRVMLAGELEATRISLSKEISLVRTDSMARLDVALVPLNNIPSVLDNRLALIQKDLNAHVESTLNPVSQTLNTLADTSYDMFVCYDEKTGYHNADCFYNRYVGLSRGIEDSASAMADIAETMKKSAPVFVASTTQIAQNVDSITANVDKAVDELVNPPLWKRVVNWVCLTGGVVGRVFVGH